MDSRHQPCSCRPIAFRWPSTQTCPNRSQELHGELVVLRMNINSSLMASATSLGSSGNPVTSSCKTYPGSRASFCTRHSSSAVSPASVLSMAPVTSVRQRPHKTDGANEIGNIPGFVELDSSSSTVGWQLVMNEPNCCVFVARAPDTDSKVRNALLL